MLHIIYDPGDQTAWYPNFLSGFKQALIECKVDHSFETQLPEHAQGPVFLTRYTLYDLLRATDRPPEQVIIHEHDVWNPFTNVFDPKTHWIYSHPSLRSVLLTNPSMCPWVERYLPIGSQVRVMAAGFPYDHSGVEMAKRHVLPNAGRERLVVFPGRLNEFYQPYLSVRLGYELMDLGYRVVIASPIDPLSHYPVDLWQAAGIEVGRLAHAEYYQLLARAKAAISVTIGGSLTLALYEAHLLGATPIAPRGSDGLPPFTEMYSPRFDLLNPRSALEMLEQDVKVDVDLTWFSQSGYVDRLLKSIK